MTEQPKLPSIGGSIDQWSIGTTGVPTCQPSLHAERREHERLLRIEQAARERPAPDELMCGRTTLGLRTCVLPVGHEGRHSGSPNPPQSDT